MIVWFTSWYGASLVAMFSSANWATKLMTPGIPGSKVPYVRSYIFTELADERGDNDLRGIEHRVTVRPSLRALQIFLRF